MVDDMDIAAPQEDIFQAKDTFLKSKLGENYEVTHPQDVEKEELPIKETDNIFGTPVPTKKTLTYGPYAKQIKDIEF
jgi:hypothetical protein